MGTWAVVGRRPCADCLSAASRPVCRQTSLIRGTRCEPRVGERTSAWPRFGRSPKAESRTSRRSLGRRPARGSDRSLRFAAKRLRVRSGRATPRFGDADRDLWYAGFKHVVVEVEEDEGHERPSGSLDSIKSRLTPKEVFRRLVEQPLVAALGSDNVVRVEVAPSIDAAGRGAMLTTIVIAPDALPETGQRGAC